MRISVAALLLIALAIGLPIYVVRDIRRAGRVNAKESFMSERKSLALFFLIVGSIALIVLAAIFSVIWVVLFILVPAVLIGVFCMGILLIVAPSPNEDVKTSKRLAGVLGALVAIAMIILNGFGNYFVPSSSLNVYAPDEIWRYILVGLILGIAIIAGVQSLIPKRAVSILIACLVAASLTTFYFYLVIDLAGDAIVVVSIFFIIGIVGYSVFFPKAAREMFSVFNSKERIRKALTQMDMSIEQSGLGRGILYIIRGKNKQGGVFEANISGSEWHNPYSVRRTLEKYGVDGNEFWIHYLSA
jgi:hypothetical protein